MELVGDFRNDLLKRREVQFVLPSERNPGFEGSHKKLVEHLQVAPEHVVIKSVKNNFGLNEFLIEAFVYDSIEHKERFEPKAKVKNVVGGSNGSG